MRYKRDTVLGRSNAPRLETKKSTVIDKRISNCTNCKKGIFPHHTYKWTSNGFVHTECLDERELDAVKSIT